jgi:hypothetical protein
MISRLGHHPSLNPASRRHVNGMSTTTSGAAAGVTSSVAAAGG